VLIPLATFSSLLVPLGAATLVVVRVAVWDARVERMEPAGLEPAASALQKRRSST
jgi:hypothetical protein